MVVSVFESLEADEWARLCELMAIPENVEMLRSVRGEGKTPVSSELSTFLFVHSASAPKTFDGEAPASNGVRGHFHLEFRLGATDTDNGNVLDDEAKIDAAVDWLMERRKEVTAYTEATRSFSRVEFAPAVAFPSAPEPFTGVRGISLVREADDAKAGLLAYNATVSELADDLVVEVSFRSKLGGSRDGLTRLLDKASEIASFAVRKRATEEIEL